MVLACIEERNVRTVVLGSVAVGSGWERDVAWLLAGWHSCVPSVKGPEVFVVNVVGELSSRLSGSILQGSLVVVTRIHLDWLHDLIWGVSHNNFYGVEAYSAAGFLRLRMESARTAKAMENFLGMNAVNRVLYCYRLFEQLTKKTCRDRRETKYGGGVLVFKQSE